LKWTTPTNVFNVVLRPLLRDKSKRVRSKAAEEASLLEYHPLLPDLITAHAAEVDAKTKSS
jgi:hypothetical protein